MFLLIKISSTAARVDLWENLCFVLRPILFFNNNKSGVKKNKNFTFSLIIIGRVRCLNKKNNNKKFLKPSYEFLILHPCFESH